MDFTPKPLIFGLPDDIAFSCLARIPHKFHSLLKCVSKRWRELVCSEEWHSYRRKHNLAEPLIYALCKNKFEQLCCYVLDPNMLTKGWKHINDPPQRSFKRNGMGFEVLGNKLYLLGGCGWVEDASDEVYCYDTSTNTWSEGAPLSTPRCYFACEAVDAKIYAFGGLESDSSDPHSWDIFDSHTNSWASHMDPNIVPEIEDTVLVDGKIYVRCGSSAVSSHVYAVVYEPSSGAWQHMDADLASGWRGPAVAIEGTLYVLDQSSGSKLMMLPKNSKEWVPIGRLSPLLTKPKCQLVAIGKKIYIIGKGLRTLVFDVETAAIRERVLVSSSVLKLNSVQEIIRCRSVWI